ncbi:MAG: putative methylamine utilization protein MauG [Candidatus Eremiobacteraeota bacterium]|nr:putative methylamine utilization protein MauG [Candidatus Eremiobacteraeota bacterium]
MRRAILVLLAFAALEAGLFAAGGVYAQKGAARQATLSDIVAQIDREEARTLRGMDRSRLDRSHSIELLGKLIFFDRQLSVNRNEACAFCHMPQVGFTGAIQAFNLTTVAYPGSVRSRFSQRKPQSAAYAVYSPVFHYDEGVQNFYGGNFWDARATGWRLGSPAAEQAERPPINPVEMGSSDTACVVHRLAGRPYRKLFEAVWGPQAFAITWPAHVDQICSVPGGPLQQMNAKTLEPNADPVVLRMSPIDRGRSHDTFDQMAFAIAAYEGSSDVSPFSSKFDALLAGNVKLTAQEQRGYDLFRGQGNCNSCHLDGNGTGSNQKTTAANVRPLFTDETSENLGVPANPDLAFYNENKPDADGYVANPAGRKYVDTGLADMLSSSISPDASWKKLAPQYVGAVKVPTVRNVDMRPNPSFIKPYMHNGYFKNLKDVVHFYNTRDVLPRCRAGDHLIVNVMCWPAPEVSVNQDKTIGNLKLTAQQEDDIVAFMKTLTDGYTVPKSR